MPRTVTILPDVATSSLGLGCAGIFREPTRSGRRRLLAVAFESGIRHFDVAPMYGLGAAERELGSFSRGRRGEITIATKFGIVPTPLGRFAGVVQSPFRWLLARRPNLSQAARQQAAGPSTGRAGDLLYRSTGYDAVSARRALDESLRQLSTDYVDLFLLHDPQPGSVRSEELCAFLDKAIADGKIRGWGVAGETDPTSAVLADLPRAPSVVQLPYDVAAPLTGRDASIRFGVVGTNLPRLLTLLADSDVRRRWSEETARECSTAAVLSELLLRSAFRDTPDGVVLYSSVQESRLREAAILADRSPLQDDGDLERFRRLAAKEL
jgi:D-threo-aldose 1-dehydrogenase